MSARRVFLASQLPLWSRWRVAVADLDAEGRVVDAAAVVDSRFAGVFLAAPELTGDQATRDNVQRWVDRGKVRELAGVCP